MNYIWIEYPSPSNHPGNKIYENEEVYAVFDVNPATKGHTLLIPKQHIEAFFSANDKILNTLVSDIKKIKMIIDEKHHPDGYNILINCGKVAGQIIPHLYIHIIPQYRGKEKKILE